MTDRPITDAEWDWFERDRLRRLTADIDRKIVDSLGNPLRDPDFGIGGTFSNLPEPKLDLDAIAAAAREIEAVNAASRPKRFDFDNVSVAGFWVRIQKIEFVESHIEYGMGTLVVTSHVPDRNTGKPIEITFNHTLSVKTWNSPRRAEIIRQSLRSWLHHEIDEHIFADGKRAFEPHADPLLTFLEDPFMDRRML